MFTTTDFAAKATAAVLTLVFSSLAVLGAVAPAQADTKAPAIVRIA